MHGRDTKPRSEGAHFMEVRLFRNTDETFRHEHAFQKAVDGGCGRHIYSSLSYAAIGRAIPMPVMSVSILDGGNARRATDKGPLTEIADASA